MKKMIFALVLTVVMSSFTSKGWSIGGEIGNGRSLKAMMMGFELEYPKDWTEISMEYLVSLSPSLTRLDEKTASYSVVLLDLPEITTLEHLNIYLSDNFPNAQSEPADLKGVMGYRLELNTIGVLENSTVQEFYLKEPGKILRISYDLSPRHISQVTAIYNSFQWMK